MLGMDLSIYNATSDLEGGPVYVPNVLDEASFYDDEDAIVEGSLSQIVLDNLVRIVLFALLVWFMFFI